LYLCLRYSSFIYRLQNRLEGGGERGEGCHPSDLLCWLTVIWSGSPTDSLGGGPQHQNTLHTTSSKTTGLAQHSGPHCWLRVTQEGVILYLRHGRSMPPALTDHTACPPVWGCSAARVWQLQLLMLLLVYYYMYSSNRHDGNHRYFLAYTRPTQELRHTPI
jgi:hypothetical protein